MGAQVILGMSCQGWTGRAQVAKRVSREKSRDMKL